MEDDHQLREALRDLLGDLGFSVREAGNGQEAIAAAAERMPDILIVDVKMKGMDGLQTLAALKEQAAPFQSMVITGYATEEDSIRAIKLGVGDYLKKPFALEVFVSSVERLARSALLQKRLKIREDAGHRLMRWALALVAGSLDLSNPLESMSRRKAGVMSTEAARTLGFSTDLALQVGNAVLLVLLSRETEENEVGLLVENAPPKVLELVEEIRFSEDASSDCSVAGVLGGAVVALTRSLDRGELGEWIQSRVTPEQAAKVLAALEGSGEGAASNLTSTPGQSRGLLALGRALKAGGDLQGASQAFESVVDSSELQEQKGEALLELALLNGPSSGHLELLRECLPLLSPIAAARLKVELALAAELPSLSDRGALLKDALQTFERHNLRGAGAKARLGLWLLGDVDNKAAIEAFRFLDAPGEFQTFVSLIPRLLPPLLSKDQPLGPVNHRKLLRRMVKESPRSVLQLVRSEVLSLEALGRLMDYLEELSASAHHDTLQLLSRCKDSGLRGRAQTLLAADREQGVPALRVTSFGVFSVHLGDLEITDDSWGSQKAKYLLACVLSRPSKIEQELLVEHFWPESPPGRGKKNLYQTLSLLRKTLKASGFAEGLELVERQGTCLSLNRNVPIWHDYDQWRLCLERARSAGGQGRTDEAYEALQGAFELYRGPFLEGCYMEWAQTIRRSVEHEAMTAFSELSELTWERGEYQQFIGVARRLLEFDPCRQSVHRLIMESYLQLGRPEDAIRQFENCERILRSEMGMEPATELLRTLQKAKLDL